MNSDIIVAIIMIGMLVAFIAMAIIANKKGNSGFSSSVKFDGKSAKTKDEERTKK